MLRSHTCGELRADAVGQTVTLCGWVDTYRDHGGTLFVDLRDRYGLTQVVFEPSVGAELMNAAALLRSEWVIAVTGKVAPRPAGTVKTERKDGTKVATGEIEVRVAKLEILNKCPTPPFTPGDRNLPGEETRLKYRYLDLRRKPLQDALLLRARIIKTMRDYFDEHNFVDVETPILGRSTPEGARDYLVPSRVHPGMFYALPQSPQLYKQLMMIAGYDRYVQVARCFRDEDLRADRQPEFTQLDVEMSFIDSDDIMGVIEGLVKIVAKKELGLDVPLPLPRMTYDEAMRRFGHDAPDLRFGMEIVDCTDLAKTAEFRVFKESAESGKFVRAINAKGAAAKYSRKLIDELTDWIKHDFGAAGLAWFKVEAGKKLASPIAKNFSEELLAQFAERMGAEEGDFLLFVADSWEVSCKSLYGLRKRLAKELGLYKSTDMHFSWIVEFPMFAKDEESNGWAAMHHPFTAPLKEHVEMLSTDPESVRAQAYDLVINGSEAGGGTIRIHDSEVQSKVFELLGMDKETARDRFGFLLDALQFGAPPHGGIALGIDRWIMLFGGLDNIRDCIAFPKTQKAADMMTEAPNQVDAKQLRELHVKTVTAADK